MRETPPLRQSAGAGAERDRRRRLAPISGVVAVWLACPAGVAPAAAATRTTLAVDSTTSRVRIALGRAGVLKFLGHDHTIEAPVESGRVEIVDGDPARSSVSLRFESRRLAIVPGTEPETLPRLRADYWRRTAR